MAEGVQSAEQNGRRRFAAFISYAHADAAIASKLQSRLERYRLPKHLAQSHTDGQAALGQIFRDREDLAAAPSLSDAIRAAISEAEALIVICSPDAAASRWVGEEIALFRSLHPEKPILAAVVRGTPVEAFPAALTTGGNEPLAADLRKEADGQSLGFLKIVAGIAGVPLDALVQRDAQRRIRRVMWITGGALAAMLVMGVMTTLALSARNEAARQRASAEGLVEYMLTDLRDKLKGVGRIDIMDAVNERAMNHYEKQNDLAGLPDDSLERRARVLLAMGEDDQKRESLDKALEKFRSAHRVTKTLLAREPDKADRIFAHAQSEFWVGYAHFLKGNYTDAERFLLAYQKLATQLATLPGEGIRGATEIGYAASNLCALSFKRGDKPSVSEYTCSEAVSAQRALIRIAPKDINASMSLANSLAWQADASEETANLSTAQSLRAEQISILDRLMADDPKNMDIAEFRLTAMMASARLHAKAGHPSEALEQWRQQHPLAVKLTKHDPENAVWAKRVEEIEQQMRRLTKEIESG